MGSGHGAFRYRSEGKVWESGRASTLKSRVIRGGGFYVSKPLVLLYWMVRQYLRLRVRIMGTSKGMALSMWTLVPGSRLDSPWWSMTMMVAVEGTVGRGTVVVRRIIVRISIAVVQSVATLVAAVNMDRAAGRGVLTGTVVVVVVGVVVVVVAVVVVVVVVVVGVVVVVVGAVVVVLVVTVAVVVVVPVVVVVVVVVVVLVAAVTALLSAMQMMGWEEEVVNMIVLISKGILLLVSS
jgi:hypothetical protein